MEGSSSTKVSKPIRRSRIPLSCEACRSRKLKCNREKPCQNCSARGETCYFKGSANGAPLAPARDQNGEAMRQRLDHLEDMVKTLVQQNQEIVFPNESQTSSSATLDPDQGRMGITFVDKAHSVYKATQDWHDVLREVNKLKEAWNETMDEADAMSSLSNSVDGTSLLFNQVDRVDVHTILDSLPPKAEVAKLLSWFFDRANFPIAVPPIIHEKTFMREYEDHWKNPTETGIIWVGLLFSILGVTMLASQFGGMQFEGTAEERFHTYRQRAAQCLLMGDIAKCLPYTIETLRLNATAELNRKDDNGRGLWIMTGVLVRAAVNMGYHRDPDHTPSLSMLQAEYRRRVWLSVVSMDEVASFLSGFPCMTSALNSDTKEPRSVHDWELDSETSVLPPSRPPPESTPATYLIVKGRLFHALGKIIDFINGPNPDDYGRVVEIDRLLYETWSHIPPHIKLEVRQVERIHLKSPADHSNIQLVCMYHHGVCRLHRRFIRRADSISRARVIASSLELIKYQRLLQPSWYAFSRTRQMLAPAAMALMLELETRRRLPGSQSMFSTSHLLEALRSAVGYWANALSSCDEAAKIYRLLDEMLRAYEAADEITPKHSVVFQPGSIELPDRDFSLVLAEKDIDWAWWDDIVGGSGLWD
ncbi:Zn(II)2Cys6 transcription factor [Aspergillus stella-maris]|uniref:Zn(II)2Cys6 transcription factor n=1 Tax=Aspergillus stella-maris TaxID=1810926 RepID=UPI003CCDB665